MKEADKVNFVSHRWLWSLCYILVAVWTSLIFPLQPPGLTVTLARGLSLSTVSCHLLSFAKQTHGCLQCARRRAGCGGIPGLEPPLLVFTVFNFSGRAAIGRKSSLPEWNNTLFCWTLGKPCGLPLPPFHPLYMWVSLWFWSKKCAWMCLAMWSPWKYLWN